MCMVCHELSRIISNNNKNLIEQYTCANYRNNIYSRITLIVAFQCTMLIHRACQESQTHTWFGICWFFFPPYVCMCYLKSHFAIWRHSIRFARFWPFCIFISNFFFLVVKWWVLKHTLQNVRHLSGTVCCCSFFLVDEIFFFRFALWESGPKDIESSARWIRLSCSHQNCYHFVRWNHAFCGPFTDKIAKKGYLPYIYTTSRDE